MKYDGILFDLDGTLWNATEPIAVSWAIAAYGFGQVPEAPQISSISELLEIV